jgi:hypothetical protein
MRYLSLVGLYNMPTGAASLASGVSYNTQPTDIPYNAQVVEDKKIYEYVRMSGTATVGSFVYYTGTALNYVCCSGTGGVKPAGVLMVSPTTSGAWTFIQKYGVNTSIQITSTFSTAYPSVGMFVDGGSAAINQSAAISGALIGSAGVGMYVPVGQALTAATGSQVVGFINLL